MRARAHQRDTRGSFRTKDFPDGTQIREPRGPKPRKSYHSSDLPKHGHREDSRGRVDRVLAEVGVTDPTYETRRNVQHLIKTTGSEKVAQSALKEEMKRILKKGGSVTAGGVIELDKVVVSSPLPTFEEWEKICARSKSRRRSIAWAAEKAGFKLIGSDPKTRESWTR